MLRLPKLHKYYGQNDCLDSVYEALRATDLSECVVTAMKVLEENNMYLEFKKILKSGSDSIQNIMRAKVALSIGRYQLALWEYNKAIMLAPPDSEEIKIAYYGRAEVLLQTEQFSSCIKDVETCLAMECTGNMFRNLRIMKEVASVNVQREHFGKEQASPFVQQFFQIKGERNPEIPCASADIKVIMDSQRPKVVAAKDIPVGTVLAIDTAFVSACNELHQLYSCHYCLKMSFNLIPCDECCVVLFCDETCKEKSIQEGHNIECKIIELLMTHNISCLAPIKAMLKMRQMCESWDEFIAASHDLGVDRMKNSSVEDSFGSNKFSVLCSHNDHHFVHGAMFNSCMYFANVIHYLDTMTTFLPNTPEEKNAAIRAVSRILMHLSLYSPAIIQTQCTNVATTIRRKIVDNPNIYYFPLIGKLSHSCVPNAYVMAMCNDAVLVTTMPIEQGAELTISHISHWLEEVDEANKKRAEKLFYIYNIACNCVICSCDKILNTQPLNQTQKKNYKKFTMHTRIKSFPEDVQSIYALTCKTLQLLSDAPFSKEYAEVFERFITCLIYIQVIKCPNIVMTTTM